MHGLLAAQLGAGLDMLHFSLIIVNPRWHFFHNARSMAKKTANTCSLIMDACKFEANNPASNVSVNARKTLDEEFM